MKLVELLARGSESYIYLDRSRNVVIKDRVRREYMEIDLDEKLRKIRTTTEYNILRKLYGEMNVPRPISKSTYQFEMEYIDGDNPELDREIALYIGKMLRKLHDNGIIHYDLSVYNILYDGERYYIIDFGLSFYSKKLEDIASDILVAISQAVDYEDVILESYHPDPAVIARIHEIRSRARYADI
ncbi:MAG: RIO1 family regulatory kinase/ATPase [Candidatus Anstonellales archaeon]